MRGFRTTASALGRQRWAALALRNGREMRIARVTAGLTQKQLAHRAGVSQSIVSLAEAGHPGISLEVRCLLAAAAGHEVGIKLYPKRSIPLRDSGQLAIANVIGGRLHERWRCRLEVPTGPGLLQAADMVVDTADEVVQIEIERAVVDFQAQWRAAALKRQTLSEGERRPVRLVLAVPRTDATRALIQGQSELLSRTLSVPSRTIWRALRTGSPVNGDGLLLVH